MPRSDSAKLMDCDIFEECSEFRRSSYCQLCDGRIIPLQLTRSQLVDLDIVPTDCGVESSERAHGPCADDHNLLWHGYKEDLRLCTCVDLSARVRRIDFGNIEFWKV
jgi:hypothetical protein